MWFSNVSCWSMDIRNALTCRWKISETRLNIYFKIAVLYNQHKQLCLTNKSFLWIISKSILLVCFCWILALNTLKTYIQWNIICRAAAGLGFKIIWFICTLLACLIYVPYTSYTDVTPGAHNTAWHWSCTQCSFILTCIMHNEVYCLPPYIACLMSIFVCPNGRVIRTHIYQVLFMVMKCNCTIPQSILMAWFVTSLLWRFVNIFGARV